MNVNKSGYLNHRMVNLKMDVVKMANGITPVRLNGYTLRAMKMGPTYQENSDWRACCAKCQGEGKIIPEEVDYEVLEVDARGRINVCFACQGKGFFPLPKPELYKEFLVLWLMEKDQKGKYEEIARVCKSELEYIDWLNSISTDDAQFEVVIRELWEWVERRLKAVEEGAPFFTTLDQKFVDRFNRQAKKEVSIADLISLVTNIITENN